MDLTKKSMKWLVAVFVVFAMILTAVFAAGHVATASANENEQEATVRLWVTDSAELGEYPNLIRSAAQRTITVDYGFEITEDSDFSIFAISPVLIYEDSDPVKPTEITLNPAFSSIVAFEYADSNAGGYLASNGATAFTVDLTDENAKSTDLSAYVNDEWDSAKYLFRATYVISANAYGVYELSFGANTAFTLESGSYYLPEIENGDFAIRAPIDIPVAVTGLVYNADFQVGVTEANGDPLMEGDNWLNPDFSLVDNTVIEGKFAGGYSAVFALEDPINTCWADNTTANQTVNWSIAVLPVEKPEPASVSVTYNGEEQFYPASQNTYYTYSGSGTNVGDYDVTVALDNVTHGNSLIWVSADPESPDTASFDVEDAFSITPAAVTLSFNDNNEGYTSAYGSSLANIEVSASGLFGNDSLGTLGYSVVDNQQAAVANFGSTTPIGTYTLTTTYTTPNANYTVTTDTANYVITKKQVTKPAQDNTVFTYNGSAQTYTLATSSDYTITGDTTKTNAGSNNITVALVDKTNTEWTTGGTDNVVYTFTINKKSVTIAFSKPSYTSVYGEPLEEISLAATGLVNENDLGTISYVVMQNEQFVELVNVGQYSLVNTYSANSNYQVTQGAYATYTITTKQVAKPAEDNTSFTYNGSAQTYTLATSSDYTITGDTTKTNAGSNNITIALVDKTNTEWTTGGTADVEYTFTIAKKAVTLDFYDSDDEEPWHLTFVTTYPDSMYYITVKATGLIGANDLGELGFIATNDMTHAVADITVEGAPAGYYTLTPTYTPNANYDVTALQGTARVYVRDVIVPVVVTDTYYYDGTAKAIVFDEVSSQGYSQYYTITGNSLTEPGTTTVTVALKDEYAGNVIWGYDERVDEYLDTTDDQTFTLTVNAVTVDVKFSVTTSAGNTVYYYNYENEALVATTENEWVAASFDVRDALPAYPTYSFFHTAGWKSGNNVVTAVTAAMSGETLTLNAHYTYNVGAGDVDGDGLVTTRDLIKMKRYYIGLETEVLEDAAAAWEAAVADSAEAPVFVSALDSNGSGAFRINDLVTIREALATGYDFRIVVGRQGVTGQSIENVQVLTVYEYDEFVAAVKTGIPVKFGANITAEDARFDELLDIPVDIDLNGKALTVEYFGLNSNANDVTLSIKGGTIYAFDDIVITAPNGNVKLDNVTGYNYVTDEVILAAASNSLHFDRVVEFLKYPEGSAMFADKIAALNAIAALSSENEQEQAAAVAEFNTATKAEVSIPVDTHVVVEENASLEVKQITVVAASNQEVETKTFSVSVKNDQASVIKVDISEVKEVIEQVNVYHVDEVALEGDSSKVEIVKAENQTVDTTAGVRNEAELNAALASDIDVIEIAANFALASWVDITRTVTINGNGYTLTASGAITEKVNNNSRNYGLHILLEQDINAVVTINDLNLVTTDRQAAILPNCDYDSTIILNNVNIHTDGEAIYANGLAHVYANNCTFTHEGLYAEGKDPVYYSALIVGYAGSITAENCTVTSFGNGVSTFPSGGSITLINTDITINESASVNENAGYALWARNEDYTSPAGYVNDSIITVQSGNIVGDFRLTDKYTGTHAKNIYDPIISISGGTFDADPSAYVANGYAATENNGIWTVAPAGAARIGSTVYQTVQAAINAAQNGDTIVLLADVTDGTGLMTEDSAPKTLTIDFNGKTYTVVGGAVGSSGTLTQAMHWSAGSDITLTNGTLTVSSAVNAAGVRMSMQNHGDLTVSNMVMNLDGITVTNYGTYTGDDAKFNGLERPQFCTNDNASIAIVNSTLNFPSNSNFGVYNESTNASIVNSTINGTVALSTGPTTDTASITIDSASTVTGGVVGYFAYDLVTEKNGTHTVKQGGARIGSTYYADVKAALNAAQANDTVVITANNALGAAVATYPATAQGNVTIDLAGHSVNGGSMGVIKNSSAYELTIVDTVGGGSVNGTGNYTLYNSGTGAITLNSGSITNTTASGTRIAVYNSSTGTFNMNGGSISGGKIAVKNSSTGTVNLYGGTLSGYWVVINADAGTINLDGATITSVACSDDSGIESQKNGVVNVISGSITARTGIATWNKVGNDAAVNVTGGTITSSHICISTNGNDTYATSINVSGGTLVSGECGIYNAGMGNVTVSGTASITGVNSGIETRAGVLTVTGGTITSTADTVLVEANGNGTTTTGAGIAVIQHTTKQAVTVSVTGGTITGVDAILEANPQNNSDADLALISITIGADATLVGDVVITDEAKITYTNNQNA